MAGRAGRGTRGAGGLRARAGGGGAPRGSRDPGSGGAGARSARPGRAGGARGGRRAQLGGAAAAVLASAALAGRVPASAAEGVAPFSVESLPPGEGWTSAGASGVRFRIVREGVGDRDAGIFDPPAAFKTFPFVAVRFDAYTEDGRRFFSTEDLRKAEFAYQVGVRQGLEDEFGGVNQMIVGERRQFVVPEDVTLENISGGKLFGRKVPPGTAVLVDVTLLSLRPY